MPSAPSRVLPCDVSQGFALPTSVPIGADAVCIQRKLQTQKCQMASCHDVPDYSPCI